GELRAWAAYFSVLRTPARPLRALLLSDDRDDGLLLRSVNQQPIIVRKPGQLLAFGFASYAINELRLATLQDHFLVRGVVFGVLGCAGASSFLFRILHYAHDFHIAIGEGFIERVVVRRIVQERAELFGIHRHSWARHVDTSGIVRLSSCIGVNEIG